MAKIYGQLEKAQLENTTSDTASHPKGMITYRTDLNQAKVSNGTAYKLLIDEDSTQTLSNKTYANPSITGAITAAQTTTPANPASGSNKLYFKADGKLYTLDSAGNEAMVGSGTGGVKNLITNGNADDTSSSIFVPYADAASTRPVDGTGGSPTVTTSMTTSTPLDGVKSFLLTKPASNVQGQGWSVPFTVDPAYRAKSLKISVDYIVNSGTFVAGGPTTESDIIWYIYDVTNSQLIEPSNIKMFSNSSTISDKFEATFQTSATGASYRLIAHCQSTSALAYELKVDNVSVGPQTYVFGTPVTDWQSYTPSTGATNTTYNGKWRRVGDTMEVTVGFAFTGAPSTWGSVHIPTGYTIDTSKMGGFTQYGSNIGEGMVYDTAGQAQPFHVTYFSTTQVLFVYEAPTSNQITSCSNTAPYTLGNTDIAQVRFYVPIVGWASSVQMSDAADTRVISFSGTQSSEAVTANVTNISFTPNNDKVGGWSTNLYTVKVPGDYLVSIGAQSSVTGTNFQVYKNGGLAAFTAANYLAGAAGGGSALLSNLVVGDTISIRASQSATITGGGLGIFRLSGPSSIASVESLHARYSTSAGQSIPNNTATIIDFGTKSFDSHNAVTTGGSWKFTAVTAGKFRVSSMILFTSGGGWAAGEFVELMLYKNGSKYSDLNNYFCEAAHSTFVPVAGTDVIELVAGDYIDVRCRQNSGASLALNANGQNNHVEVILER